MQQRAVGLLLWAPRASDIRSIAARRVCSRRGRVSIHIHRRKLLLGPGAQAPPTFMIIGLAFMTSPPHFCDVILSKLRFNCLHWFYAMLTNRQLDHSFAAVLDILRKGLNLQAPLDI